MMAVVLLAPAQILGAEAMLPSASGYQYSQLQL
jgi:hypothetical protein